MLQTVHYFQYFQTQPWYLSQFLWAWIYSIFFIQTIQIWWSNISLKSSILWKIIGAKPYCNCFVFYYLILTLYIFLPYLRVQVSYFMVKLFCFLMLWYCSLLSKMHVLSLRELLFLVWEYDNLLPLSSHVLRSTF